jgi:hypothetical protein
VPRLGVSVEMVYRMCRTGTWPHAKVGRLYSFTEGHYQATVATPHEQQDPPRCLPPSY